MVSREEVYAMLSAKQGAALTERFSRARVAICGLGGLGSNIAIALARAGVGQLHLIDFDRIDLSNLNRQQYTFRQIGLLKTEALRDNLAEIAPYCQTTITTAKLSGENIPEILAEAPIVCEAFDNAEAKAMLVNSILERFPDKWLVAASGMAGRDSANLIRTRRIAKRFFLCGDGVSDVNAKEELLSARVLACAAHQAFTILRIIAGDFDTSAINE